MNPTRLSRIALIALLALGITLAIEQRDSFDAASIETWLDGYGTAAPLLFVLLYALATVFFFPGSVMTLAGGALFGPAWGTLYSLSGATLGAGIAFLMARHMAGDWVAAKTGGRIKQLVDGVEQEGWRFVAFVRLVPLFPFNLLNYALGLTRIRFSHYLVTSFICMAPGGFAYTYLGYAGREAIAGGENTIQKGLLALALLAVVIFLPRLVQHLRSAKTLSSGQLKTLLEQANPPLVLDVRDAERYQGHHGHIGGALNIPHDEIMPRIHRLDGHRNRTIVIVADDAAAATASRQLLEQLGFDSIYLLEGGIRAWEESGYPTEHSA